MKLDDKTRLDNPPNDMESASVDTQYRRVAVFER